jgi:ABC-2 type transport system permease protein
MNFYSLTNRNFKEIYRDPVTIILGVLLPIVFLLLFTSIQKRLPFELYSPQNLTPGIIIFSFAFIIMFSAVLLAKDKQSAFLLRLFTTPLKPTDFILSYILPFIPFAFIQILICFTTGILLGASFSNILMSLFLFLLMAFLCISLGVILGSLFTVNQVSGVGSMLITAIGLFSGVWMDLNVVGGVFESIGNALPFAHAVDASKKLLAGGSINEISGSILIICTYTIILFLLAIISFRWVMKKN